MNINRINKKERGNFGEQAVCIKLENIGYNIVCRNYRRKHGEIDIIAENSEWLVFVEVKTRSARSFTRGAEAVDKRKQLRLVQTAQLFLADGIDLCGKQIRFDVAEVFISMDEPLSVNYINYIEAAFEPESNLFLFI